MKRHRKNAFFGAAVLLFIGLVGQAWGWGSAPTHFSVANDLLNGKGQMPPVDNEELFLRANALPDLAGTSIFRTSGRDYVHTQEFAQAIHTAACKAGRTDWQDVAQAWRCHLAADAIAHEQLLPNVGAVLHSLAEGAVDTIIFFEGSPLETLPLPWSQVNVDVGWLNPRGLNLPRLLYLASLEYKKTHPGAQPVYGYLTAAALPIIQMSIQAEYDYIQAHGNPQSSQEFLDRLKTAKLLPGDWRPYYELSVESQTWFAGCP